MDPETSSPLKRDRQDDRGENSGPPQMPHRRWRDKRGRQECNVSTGGYWLKKV